VAANVISILAVGAIWAIAVTGYLVARNARPTAEKLARYVESVDLSKLTPEERAKALKKLADQIYGLSPEERRKARAEVPAWHGLSR
jgi:hypothetical protein